MKPLNFVVVQFYAPFHSSCAFLNSQDILVGNMLLKLSLSFSQAYVREVRTYLLRRNKNKFINVIMFLACVFVFFIFYDIGSDTYMPLRAAAHIVIVHLLSIACFTHSPPPLHNPSFFGFKIFMTSFLTLVTCSVPFVVCINIF